MSITGFPTMVFNACIMSFVYCSQVISHFSVVSNGGLSIYATRGAYLTVRPWFPIRIQCMLCVQHTPFRSYMYLSDCSVWFHVNIDHQVVLETEGDIINEQSYHRHSLSVFSCFHILCAFYYRYGGVTISAAKGRSRPEMTSLIPRPQICVLRH